MTKIVINSCYGGFGLSSAAREALGELLHDDDIERDNPQLVRVVEDLGEAADGPYADLQVVEIPDDVDWEIEEYDGSEWVSEKHRRWS